MTALIVVSVALLAYSNGANDNFKGVATLFGSGTTNYRRALFWAAVTTLAGSLLALFLAQGLVDTFKGKGLVPDSVTGQPAFLTAVSLGAALTVLIATLTGLPVSTTHALTGGLVGAGWLAAGNELQLSALVSTFALPLACSPILAVAGTLFLYPLFRAARQGCGVTSQTCLCVDRAYEEVIPRPDGALLLARTGAVLQVGQVADCVERYRGHLFRLDVAPALDSLHYLSAGAVSFARGLNDTPKIVALLLAAQATAPAAGLWLVAVVMAAGGLLNARRVAITMSHKITRMNTGQGFTANLVTALLVTAASRLGVPVSTTHVSVGSLFGIGLVRKTAQRKMILTIVMAWVTTLPVAAILAAAIYLLV